MYVCAEQLLTNYTNASSKIATTHFHHSSTLLYALLQLLYHLSNPEQKYNYSFIMQNYPLNVHVLSLSSNDEAGLQSLASMSSAP
jgi:hypothetical protein